MGSTHEAYPLEPAAYCMSGRHGKGRIGCPGRSGRKCVALPIEETCVNVACDEPFMSENLQKEFNVRVDAEDGESAQCCHCTGAASRFSPLAISFASIGS